MFTRGMVRVIRRYGEVVEELSNCVSEMVLKLLSGGMTPAVSED